MMSGLIKLVLDNGVGRIHSVHSIHVLGQTDPHHIAISAVFFTSLSLSFSGTLYLATRPTGNEVCCLSWYTGVGRIDGLIVSPFPGRCQLYSMI